ncbi:MAG: carbohydrate kinase family protein [Muribaculaceae bacterium]
MKKIICIGECGLDIIFAGGAPVATTLSGRVAHVATLLARMDLPVLMASEAAADPVGDEVVGRLAAAGVDTAIIDRFVEGRTPVTIYTTDAAAPAVATRYEDYRDECFDIVWPRVDEADIIVVGDYYAIDPRMRRRMAQFLSHCAERKALVVYLPGYMMQQEPRITRVMPAILDNLEVADLVITRSADLKQVFGNGNATECYRDHIGFYSGSLINVDAAAGRVDYCSSGDVVSIDLDADATAADTLARRSGMIAGIVRELHAMGVAHEGLDAISGGARRAIIESGLKAAAEAVAAVAADPRIARHV